ncbi:hypothetical protein HU200_038346 [Digitaria exilis]|uniref:Uncharacterized protein n=1 Tax=Digitaria exilis TaxID=1010633 RepID=A0A835EJ86_9POAL|nr:hypothetical protein HU200_038346 [Digitaria exilis]
MTSAVNPGPSPTSSPHSHPSPPSSPSFRRRRRTSSRTKITVGPIMFPYSPSTVRLAASFPGSNPSTFS